MSVSKQKGTAWETACVRWLQSLGWQADRAPLRGAADQGDVTGLPGVVIECKNAKTIKLSEWLGELEIEIANAQADTGVLLIKKRGKTDPGEAYAVMPAKVWALLLKESGR